MPFELSISLRSLSGFFSCCHSCFLKSLKPHERFSCCSHKNALAICRLFANFANERNKINKNGSS